jgi:hypothetical protein
VYRACAQVGLADPRKVDALELWEIAAVIGANDPLESDKEMDDRLIAQGGALPYNEYRAQALGRGETPVDIAEWRRRNRGRG